MQNLPFVLASTGTQWCTLTLTNVSHACRNELRVCKCTCAGTHTHAHVHRHTHIRTHTHMHTHTHAHAHTHTCACRALSNSLSVLLDPPIDQKSQTKSCRTLTNLFRVSIHNVCNLLWSRSERPPVCTLTRYPCTTHACTFAFVLWVHCFVCTSYD